MPTNWGWRLACYLSDVLAVRLECEAEYHAPYNAMSETLGVWPTWRRNVYYIGQEVCDWVADRVHGWGG